MISLIKREILSQLRKNGLNLNGSKLKVCPWIPKGENIETDGIGNTFLLELPNEADPLLEQNAKINRNIIKTAQNLTSVIEKIENFQLESNNILRIKVNFDAIVQNVLSAKSLFECDVDSKQKIIVEFSSPNIAKPFHVGNLRSTIIGNSIANILKFKGHTVIRMNYLGDWGTQFGILSLAFDSFGDEKKLQSQPLNHLFEIYVQGNRQCEIDPDWRDKAKKRFFELESKQDLDAFNQWTRFRDVGVRELENLYRRLGIDFDVQTSESMYANRIADVMKILETKSLINQSTDGAISVKISDYCEPSRTITVPIQKNDGTSLYLTRDIAAVQHRRKEFSFDRMYYVVDSTQHKHFHNLKSVFYSLEDPIYHQIEHIKFGRILGMSSRKGDVILLEDILDEAKQRALAAIRSSPNTKIFTELFDQVADVLGITSIIVHDLSNRRVSEYKFDWNKALQLNGNTGISIQYTHARLCSLIDNHGFEFKTDTENGINVSAIDCLEGRLLLNWLMIFDEMIELAYEKLDPSYITNYTSDQSSSSEINH
ncbi:epididymal secretory protein E1 precursor [Sarcoptes scabiei]|nr:epididymal secretory protein E1 precursor [Sarcoptes scabiei]